MTIQQSILYLKIKNALNRRPLNGIDLRAKVKAHGHPVLEHEFKKLLKKLVYEEKIYYDTIADLYGNAPLIKEKALFDIPIVFLEVDRHIKQHQDLFSAYSGLERLKHKDLILSLSESINEGINVCNPLFLSLKEPERDIIRNKISSRLKRELNKYLLENPNQITNTSSNKPIEGPIEAGEEGAIAELPEKIDLNDFISAFDEHSAELLYPILFKGFPNREFIHDKLEQIITNLIDSFETIGDEAADEVLNELQIIFQQGLNTLQHDAFLYDLIYQYKEQYNQEFEDARAIALLKSQLDDPFKHFFNLSNLNMEHLSFAEDSADFDHIIREVCRDNVITIKERAYLEEKAKEYFIDTDKLEHYLNNPFLGYETFKIFVDQICKDGIVTDTEREYINEKARQYNVPKKLLDKMISTGLLRAQFASQLAKDDDFYEIVLIYLFANAYNLKPVEQRLANMLTIESNDQSITDQLETKKEVLFDDLCEAVNEKKELEALQIEYLVDIQEVYNILKLEPASISELLEKGLNINDNKEKGEQDVITLDWNFSFDTTLENPIYINYLNKKVILKNKNGAFNTFLNNLFLERDKHRGPEIDLFFENFEDFYNEK